MEQFGTKGEEGRTGSRGNLHFLKCMLASAHTRRQFLSIIPSGENSLEIISKHENMRSERERERRNRKGVLSKLFQTLFRHVGNWATFYPMFTSRCVGKKCKWTLSSKIKSPQTNVGAKPGKDGGREIGICGCGLIDHHPFFPLSAKLNLAAPQGICVLKSDHPAF